MNNIIPILLILFAIGYTAEIIFLWLGLKKISKQKHSEFSQPFVSIIVAARNEETTIAECIESLSKLEYPKDKFEIIIVNDHSTDRTAEKVSEFSRNISNLKLVHAADGTGNLRGKANAIHCGVEVAQGEILMFTDADCKVPPKWITSTIPFFQNDVGIVAGFTLLEAKKSFQGIQSLDWLFLFGVAAGMAGWGIPLTGIGNNLSIRSDAYKSIGGFPNIRFSVTEDYALVQAILQKTKYKLNFNLNIETLIRSNPCETWKDLYRQKQRWGVGGLDMIPPGIIVMSIGWTFKLLLVISIFFTSLKLWSTIFISKCLIDLFFLLMPIKIFKAFKYLRFFLLFEVYYIIYVIILPFVAILNKKVVWKSRKL